MNDTISPDEPLPTRTETEGATVDLPANAGFFSTGQVLGERYEILEMLGRGGMGEVWRAFDLKLRVEVALKALREDLFQSEGRHEMLRQEVRAAREVVSPNVCRIFDLIEIDGRELVSMEYVDGATLLGVLQERGPLELKEAQDIASQFLSGLEAIHKAGLVHRDVKPENIMLTRAGRVVVMDFGLARGPESGAGSVSGTPAYMAPEHAGGQEVDARADVYSAGVVLAEMVSPDGIKSFESRHSVWEGVRSEPAQVPDTPWAAVIQRAVARDRERRQDSAHTLIRELEEVTLRVEGAEDLHPYPGLASFTEDNADFFFGREAEVEQMWRLLEGPPRLFAVMGPSGAGKTSFLNAGVIPQAGAGWSVIRCTPGNAAVASLRGALTPELPSSSESLRRLVTDPDNPDVVVEAARSWREGLTGALLLVDQFEELFTLNPRDEQGRFASLLGQLPLEADVHVVLSMRDDFASSCNRHESLRPVFKELAVLDPPTGGNLRRALVQPATKCGYRFEDDDLVEEILAEVEGERGALPLLAFALARLWEKRDRDTGLLTRQAYHDIGGVGGALARHAEATVDRIGTERIPIVRELFRNLVTAEGTRAVREWGELLSVFEGERVGKLESEKVRKSALPPVASEKSGVRHATPHSEQRERSPSHSERSERSPSHSPLGSNAAEEVLRELIDARLLTSYEVRRDEHEPIRRVEIIHESLLANWPRLVRWQTQDADAVQVREQLRQAARTWDDNDRTEDMLWTGSAYRQYSVWREGYPGGLTEVEESFAAAMVSLANRNRRRRRFAIASGFAVLLAILAVVGGFWRQSIRETRKAEASSLIALGQVELESYPSSTVAHVIASLELEDSETARRLALDALWKGPTAFVLNEYSSSGLTFSPDGSWLIQLAASEIGHFIHSRDGTQRSFETDFNLPAVFGASDDLFLAHETDLTAVSLRSAREGRVLSATIPLEEGFREAVSSSAIVGDGPDARAVFATRRGGQLSIDELTPDGGHEVLGTLEVEAREDWLTGACMPRITGDWVAVVESGRVSVVDIAEHGISDRRLLGRFESFPDICVADPLGRFFVTTDFDGRIALWDVNGRRAPTMVNTHDHQALGGFWSLSVDGSYLVTFARSVDLGASGDIQLWSVDGFDLRPVRRLADVREIGNLIIDPVGLRLAMAGPEPATRLWSLGAPAEAEPTLLRRGSATQQATPRFSPDGRWLATTDGNGLAMWPLAQEHPIVIRKRTSGELFRAALASDGRFLLTVEDDKVLMVELDRDLISEGRVVLELENGGSLSGLQLAPDDRHFTIIDEAENVWIGDLETGTAREAPTPPIGRGESLAFSLDGRYLASCFAGNWPTSGIVVWDLETGREVASLHLDDAYFGSVTAFIDDGRVLVSVDSGVMLWDPATGKHEIVVETEWCPVFDATDDGRRLVVVVLDENNTGREAAGCPVFYDLDTGLVTPLESHGRRVLGGMRLDADGERVVTADLDGVIRVGPVTGEEPHLLLGQQRIARYLEMDRSGRRIVTEERNGTIRIWPVPDVSKPPLHTLPRSELIAKLKTLTNLRVVRDPDSATGWTLTHDPFPGWETVPTW